MSEIVTHLWSSTLVLAVALALSHALPVTARTRYALLFCGLLKFAIPFAAINLLCRSLGFDLTNLTARSAGSIAVQWLGGTPAVAVFSPHPASRWPEALMIAWLVPSVLLAVFWAIARRRMVSSALHENSAASPREINALTAARRRLGLRTSVEVRRSAVCEAPAVVRIIRPVVILPDGGCDALDDDELESVLRHECAHVARRDNLLSLCESAVMAGFWFHPLIWVAHRAIITAREEACDESAASSGGSIETYVLALSKICGAVLAPRLSGVSCMASAHLKERLEYLMKFDVIRNRALSHNFVLAFAAVIVVAVTVGSGLRAASSPEPANTPYVLHYYIRAGELPDTFDFHGRVVEVATDRLLMQPNVTFKRGAGATIDTVAQDRDIRIELRDTGTRITAMLRVSQNGTQLQETSYVA